MDNLKQKLAAEAHRIEEDTDHSSKGHFNAADRWGGYHLWIGVPAAITAAIAGAAAFKECPELAGSLAILSTALTTVLTFLKPSERAENHKAVAGQYLALRNRARIFREIELEEVQDLAIAKKQLLDLAAHRDDLNESSPGIPRQDYENAKRDIDEGRSRHQVDEGAA